MPEINQYAVKPKELAELIVKSANIHEGRWMLAVTFGLAPGNFGPNESELAPGVAVVVQSVFIQREQPGTPPAPEGMVVDAALVNPAPRAKAR
jgi:hypothetical protein